MAVATSFFCEKLSSSCPERGGDEVTSDVVRNVQRAAKIIGLSAENHMSRKSVAFRGLNPVPPKEGVEV